MGDYVPHLTGNERQYDNVLTGPPTSQTMREVDDVVLYAREGLGQIRVEADARKEDQRKMEERRRARIETETKRGRNELAGEIRLIDKMYTFIYARQAPWNTLDILEAAELEFPLESSDKLRLIISSVLIGLRRGSHDLMELSMADDLKKDDQGALLITINRGCITRFNTSS